MKLNFIFVLLNICLWIFLVVVAGYVVYLVIKRSENTQGRCR